MIIVDGKETKPGEVKPGFYISKESTGLLTPVEVYNGRPGRMLKIKILGVGLIEPINESDYELYSVGNCIIDQTHIQEKPDTDAVVKIEYYVDVDKHGPAVTFPKGPFADPQKAVDEYKAIAHDAPHNRTVTLEKFTTTREVMRKSN